MERGEYIISGRNAASAGRIRVSLDNDILAPLILISSKLTVDWLVSDDHICSLRQNVTIMLYASN